MKLNPSVRKETVHIALGVLIGDVLMAVVFALLHKLDLTVILGAVWGSAAAIGNFLLMGLSVQKAMEDPDQARIKVQRSYTLRMLGLVAVMVVGVFVPWFHPVAVMVPILLPSIIIVLLRVFYRGGARTKGGEEQ